MEFAWKHVRSICDVCAIFVPYFDSPPIDHETLLDCGDLILTTGSLGDYHIEWKLDEASQDATTVFTSGITTDPGEVQMQHPFSSPQPVLAGTLYPVFKYIYVNGIRYSAYSDDEGVYAPSLLTCLGPYIVDALNCASTLGTDLVYPYHLEYDNIADFGDNKSRVLKFDLLSETPYLAWEFEGDIIAERLDIYYCTELNPEGTLVDSFIDGQQSAPGVALSTSLYPVGYPGTRGSIISRRVFGGTFAYAPLRFVSKFTDFTWSVGDFLLIEITGSVLEPTTTNTNWSIKLKCLYSLDFECGLSVNSDIGKIISTPYMVYEGDPTCQYRVYYNTLDRHVAPVRSDPSTHFLEKYLTFTSAVGSGGASVSSSTSTSPNPVYIGLGYNTTAASTQIHTSTGFNTCLDLGSETVLVEYNAGDIIYTFSDVDDYDKYKADYAAFQADAEYITWTGLTDSDPRYYARILIYHYTATSCGDISTTRYFYVWFGSTFTFDDINQKMTVTCTVPTNVLSDITCDNVKESIDTDITWFIRTRDNSFSFYAIPVGGLLSNVRTIGLIYANWTYGVVNATNTGYRYAFVRIEDAMINGLCDLSIHGFCKLETMWTIYRLYDRLTLTDPTDHASRLANWRLERLIGLRTDDCNDLDSTDWEIVYEVP